MRTIEDGKLEEMLDKSADELAPYVLDMLHLINALLKKIPDPVEEQPEGLLTLADVMERYNGTREYDGVVAICQKWYYGRVYKAPWCATFLSWCLAQMGLLAITLDTKLENVYNCWNKLMNKVREGKVTLITSPSKTQRGDIVVFNWDESFNTVSSKHIAVATGNFNGSQIEVIGGNQDDMICCKFYSIDKMINVFRPNYKLSTLKSLENLPNA